MRDNYRSLRRKIISFRVLDKGAIEGYVDYIGILCDSDSTSIKVGPYMQNYKNKDLKALDINFGTPEEIILNAEKVLKGQADKSLIPPVRVEREMVLEKSLLASPLEPFMNFV